jgi:hypothetical protein
MSEIAFFYDETKNQQGRFISGVPLRNLTQDEVDALPPHKQASLAASPMYLTALDAGEADVADEVILNELDWLADDEEE